ncbi:hypothetical protein UA08_03365 [Talaromyces atroroseus]|uniref:Uncharacterized protein n=1 Tax=Talaromyces atroroseus TaxID=1441469 RepID=A0A225AIE7_TALAT|nr:hypothetical protein UA08_03365 [Talaromyces atroroseus]OKL61222.1 hypothetical protein UA08_03365 [Talaromyces atroroseus]
MSSEKARINKPGKKHHDSTYLPITPVESGTKHVAADARRVATTTKATRRNRLLSSVVKNQNGRRYPSSPDWDSQITLTQLVPKTETPDDARDSVEYNEDANRLEKGRNHANVIDLVDDLDEDDVPCKSSGRQPPREQSFRSPNSIPNTLFKRRKSSSGTASSVRQTAKAGKGKNEKNPKYKGKDGNKTLTQMDFVRRYIPLPESDDDDLKLYDETLPATDNGDIHKEEQNKNPGDLLTPRKRRKLDDDSKLASPTIKSKLSPDQKTEAHLVSQSNHTPKTPQRSLKFEIPSSQTPESPYQKFLPSPDLHKVRRASLGVQSSKIVDENYGLASQSLNQEEAKTTQHGMLQSAPSDIGHDGHLPFTASPYTQSRRSPSHIKPLLFQSDRQKMTSRAPEPPPVPLDKEAIIYDTDAGTDYGDLDDDNLPQSPAEIKSPSRPDRSDCLTRHDTQNGFDSDDLPPIPNSGTDLEINTNTLSDPALASESSVYYRRPAQFTQYPNEPVPMVNTQKIAELFPIEEEEAEVEEPRESLIGTSMLSSNQFSISPTNHQPLESEVPTQEESAEKLVDMVPESSPAARLAEAAPAASTMAPPSRESIVLVESSQLVDRLSRQDDSLHAGASLRRLFSTGEFLTDSVMESIPPPPWALSQDSVGDPYPEDDAN